MVLGRCFCLVMFFLFLSQAIYATSLTTTEPTATFSGPEVTTSNNFTAAGNEDSKKIELKLERQKENSVHNQSDSRRKVDEFGELLKKKVEMLQKQDNSKV